MRVAVDMTPLGPGGQNGGAGLVATNLIAQMGSLAPTWEFVLLTSAASHDELAELDASNVTRVYVRDGPGDVSPNETAMPRLRKIARQALHVLPPDLRVRGQNAAWRLRHGRHDSQLLERIAADVLFCPFTTDYFWKPGVLEVQIVYDLQHVDYPEFFSDDQRLNRDRHLRRAAAHADRVVCISDFVRQRFLAHTGIAADRVRVIPLGLLHQFGGRSPNSRDGTYLLYPANFWQHKNHLVLFEAFALYCQRRPQSNLRLFCTGAANEAMQTIREQAEERLGTGIVTFTGYVREEQFQALLDNCRALIFPSLYEGFGMPVLEAMARGKPVLCSEIPTLTEVAGAAATYFDPTNASDICRAIATLDDDPSGIASRVEIGRARAGQFGDANTMAAKYIALFEDVFARA